MKNAAPFFHRLLAGLLIGLGCILPGVSGGVMAVSFGLYRPMLDAVMGFFRDLRKNFLFLLPLGLGGLVGLLAGARVLSYTMARWETPMLFLFIGFILGGLPGLFAQAGEGGFQPRRLWALALGVALALPMALMQPAGGGEVQSLRPLQAVIAGGVYAFGTVVPGVSTSFLLIYLGWYQACLRAFGEAQLVTLGLFALGFGLVALCTMKGVKWLFDHHGACAYYGVAGFVLVSVGLVFPGFEGGGGLYVDLLMLVLGLLGALWMERLKG